MTVVNPQITDSVTQANTKVVGDAPSIAIGSLYQQTAQALANAAHNATTAQQQNYATLQASTTQGVMTIYSIDEETTGVTASMEQLRQLFSRTVATVEPPPAAELTASAGVQQLIDELSHETADVGYHVRSLMSAFAASLDALSIANSRQQLRTLQNAAIAVCLKAMLEQPDKAREFEHTLEIIKKVV
jgi:hypothetical protein